MSEWERQRGSFVKKLCFWALALFWERLGCCKVLVLLQGWPYSCCVCHFDMKDEVSSSRKGFENTLSQLWWAPYSFPGMDIQVTWHLVKSFLTNVCWVFLFKELFHFLLTYFSFRMLFRKNHHLTKMIPEANVYRLLKETTNQLLTGGTQWLRKACTTPFQVHYSVLSHTLLHFCAS